MKHIILTIVIVIIVGVLIHFVGFSKKDATTSADPAVETVGSIPPAGDNTDLMSTTNHHQSRFTNN